VAFRPTGSVLEPACGPGVWTGELLRHASDVTAVDASAGDARHGRGPEGPSSATIRRHLGDGTPYRLVKVPRQQADLEKQLRRPGWHIKVTSTSGPFYWGAGSRG
jgi:hypothetical protein